MQKNIVHQRTAKCLIDIREEVSSFVSTARPSVQSYENELEYQHAVFLQKIIKGRAIQSILHDGKDAHQDLINQLKETFKLKSVWRAECVDDFNEEILMDFLGTYINQELDRYAEQAEIYDQLKLAERERQQQEIEEENEIRQEKEEIALDCLDEVFTDVSHIISKSNAADKIHETHDTPLNEQSSKVIVPDILSNFVLPEIYQKLSSGTVEESQLDQRNEHTLVVSSADKEKIVKDTIQHILQKVISHPVEDLTNDIIDDIVKRAIDLSTFEQLNVDSLDKEIGTMLNDLCNQLLNNLELNADNDESSSENDSPDE